MYFPSSAIGVALINAIKDAILALVVRVLALLSTALIISVCEPPIGVIPFRI